MSNARPIASERRDKNSSKALIYCRVSSDRQKAEGHGLESQEHRCYEYARSQSLEVVEVFRDSFSGGGDFMDRPAMRELLRFADDNAHEAYIVIFDDLSRFARDVQGHIGLRQALNVRNIELKCPNFTFEDTPEGELVEIVMAAQHQYFRKSNRRQVIQKQKARLESGYWAFGSKRGYCMKKTSEHGKILVPKEPDASVLREALEGFATGRFQTKVDACRFLVEKKFWKEQRPERYIDKFTAILTDSLYAGYIEYPVWEVSRRKGHHEGIISLEIFTANQQRLQQGNRGKRIRIDVSEDFPLRNLLVCEMSGKPLTAAFSRGRKKSYPYYFCQHKDCACGRGSSRAEEVHEGFDELLHRQALKSNAQKRVEETFERVWSEEVVLLEQTDRENEKKIMSLEESLGKYADGAVNARTERLRVVFEQKATECISEIETLRSSSATGVDLSVPYRTALGKALVLLENPYEIWHSVGVHEKKELFYFIFLEKVPYSKKAGYRTDNLPSAKRLFEELVASNTQDVEMAGIEPASEKLDVRDSTVSRSP